MEIVNLVIIGSGPAAYTAAIYSARAKLEPIIFEGGVSTAFGGQLMTTSVVENFPGFDEGILGPVLIEKMRNQAKKFSLKLLMEDVVSIDLKQKPFLIKGSKSALRSHALIIATGASANVLDIPGVKKFWQKGISTCAVCDGAAPIYRDKELFVIGGGDSAAEEALFLTKFGKKIYLVHRRDQLKASKILTQRVMSHPKIHVLFNTEIKEIFGKDRVEKMILFNNSDQKTTEMIGSGVFFAIGHTPNTKFLQEQIKLDEKGYIVTLNKSSKTSKEGVFAAGDVQDPSYRQAITAAASGCIAAIDAEKWLSDQNLGA